MVMSGSQYLYGLPELGHIWNFSRDSFIHVVSQDENSFLKYFRFSKDNFSNFEDWVPNLDRGLCFI